MTEPADASQNEATRGSSRWKRPACAAALLALGCALVAWRLYDRHVMVIEIRHAMEQTDASRLVRLAHVSDRREVLELAKTIWSLAASPQAESTGTSAAATCVVVHTLPATRLEWLLGHRDLLVIPVHRDNGYGIDVFYFRLRGRGLKAGADPRKFDRLEGLAGRLLDTRYRE